MAVAEPIRRSARSADQAGSPSAPAVEAIGVSKRFGDTTAVEGLDLSMAAGRRIVVAAAVIPLVLAVTQGVTELVAVAAGLAMGTAYSVPPLRLKRYPALA